MLLRLTEREVQRIPNEAHSNPKASPGRSSRRRVPGNALARFWGSDVAGDEGTPSAPMFAQNNLIKMLFAPRKATTPFHSSLFTIHFF